MKKISKEEKLKEKQIYKENEAHHNDLIKLEKEHAKEEKIAKENDTIIVTTGTTDTINNVMKICTIE